MNTFVESERSYLESKIRDRAKKANKLICKNKADELDLYNLEQVANVTRQINRVSPEYIDANALYVPPPPPPAVTIPLQYGGRRTVPVIELNENCGGQRFYRNINRCIDDRRCYDDRRCFDDRRCYDRRCCSHGCGENEGKSSRGAFEYEKMVFLGDDHYNRDY